MNDDVYALVPAAGSGTRMATGIVSGAGAVVPKQYQLLAGRPLICHAVETLCTHPAIRRVFVVIAPGDAWFGGIAWGAQAAGKLQAVPCGGATRGESVLNGLNAMAAEVHGRDRVLVHDAARPCLTHALIDRLLAEVTDRDAGGLLAVPVADTLKRADQAGNVAATLPRGHLWQAQTPQMFLHAVLRDALERAGVDQVTDEASAVELTGRRPKLVMGSPRNLKVTRPDDLALAEILLKTIN